MWDPSKDFRFRDWTSADVATQKRIYQKEVEIVGAMQRAGVELLAGTDVFNPYCFPGFSLHDELGLLVKAGLTPMEALQTATRNAARFMKRENDLGTVETGKLADLVLLNDNPLEDIGNTRKIEAVVAAGRLFTRASLDEMLSKVDAICNRPSIAQRLLEVLKTNTAEVALAEYHQLKASHFEAYDFGEGELNTLGYQLLGMKRIEDAAKILELNTEAYPQSSNVYDSLGEAYMIDGRRELAIQNYEKSLRLDPKNTNAVEKLKELKAQNQQTAK
jgi:tetratricopeptide (TPR) repeat protein